MARPIWRKCWETGPSSGSVPISALLQHIITPLGVKITAAELAEELQVVWSENDSRPSSEVESFNSLSWYSLKQVWNKTDGLLDLRDVQRINWYAPEDVTGRRNDGIYTVRNNAVPIKTWKLSWSFLEEDTLVAAVLMKTIGSGPEDAADVPH